MTMRKLIGLVTIALVAASGAAHAEQVQSPRGDCRYYLGLPHYTVVRAEDQEIGTHAFVTTEGVVTVAGKVCVREYSAAGATSTGAQVAHAYFNALHAAIGREQYNNLCPESVCAKHPGASLFVGNARYGDQEVWLEVLAEGDGSKYTITELSRDLFVRYMSLALLRANLAAGDRVTLHLEFEPAREVLTPAALKTVEQIALLLAQDPKLKLSVEGHTTELSTRSGNQKLSQARANAVVEALKAQGIAETRLLAVGRGQTQPIGTDTTNEGHFVNQRIELVKR
jgi:outer membrane protein OmpA-like peptidoglycan-associated protein